MRENNIEIIKYGQNNAKEFLVKLNKFFIKELRLEQDRSDVEYTFYWKGEQLIADIGIDNDSGILICLIEANLFINNQELHSNNHVEFLPEYEGEQLLCVEVYSQTDLDLIKNLTTNLARSVVCA